MSLAQLLFCFFLRLIPRAALLVILPIALLTILAAVNDLAAAFKDFPSAHLSAISAMISIIRSLAMFRHSFESEYTFAIVETIVKLHDQTSCSVPKLTSANVKEAEYMRDLVQHVITYSR